MSGERGMLTDDTWERGMGAQGNAINSTVGAGRNSTPTGRCTTKPYAQPHCTQGATSYAAHSTLAAFYALTLRRTYVKRYACTDNAMTCNGQGDTHACHAHAVTGRYVCQ